MHASTRWFVFILLLIATVATASDIPPLPAKMPLPDVAEAFPPTRDTATSALPSIMLRDAQPQAPRAEAQPSRPRLVGANTAGWGNLRLTNDTAEEIEPVIVRAKRSNPQGVGIDTTMSAYMKRVSLGRYQINALLTEGDTYVPPPGPLPLPAGYNTSGDPFASVNPYTTGTNPRTFYVGGTGEIRTPEGAVTTSSIFVWRLIDGEITWQRSALATTTDGSRLDKPSIVVSWHPGSLGWVYAAYVKVAPAQDSTTIYMQRSIDGVNYGQSPVTFTGPDYHSPIVLVDSNTGYVYLLWLSYTFKKIYLTYSTNGGISFAPVIDFDAGSQTEPLLGPGTDLICDTSNVCVIARTMLMARYNSVDHSIGVVWHRREPVTGFINQTRTDVFFHSYSTDTHTWRGIYRVNQSNTTNDQWNAALDFNDLGNYVVAWYDRRDDPTNRKYAVYATMINRFGMRLENLDVQVGGGSRGYGSDPTVYQPQTFGPILLGEYHDVWSWYDPVNSRWIWHSADINIPWPYTQGDVYDDEIQP